MSEKSQTIGDFTFCRSSQIYRIIAIILSLDSPDEFSQKWESPPKIETCVIGGLEPSNLGDC